MCDANSCRACTDYAEAGVGTEGTGFKGGYCETPDGEKKNGGAWTSDICACDKYFTGVRCKQCGYSSNVGDMYYSITKCRNINSPQYGNIVKGKVTCRWGESDVQIVMREQVQVANNKELDFNIQLRPLIDDARFK